MSTRPGQRRISFWIPEDLAARLDEVADAAGVARTLLMEKALESFLARQRGHTRKRATARQVSSPRTRLRIPQGDPEAPESSGR